MSAERPSESELVSWYFRPSLAWPTPAPLTHCSYPFTDLKRSIRLTLQYLTAAIPPIDHGRVRPIRGHNGQQTLFWSIYEVRQDIKVQIGDGNVRTRMIILYYGFDASGRLTLETVASQSYESDYANGYSWPDPADIPAEHHAKLLEKLEKFRKKLTAGMER